MNESGTRFYSDSEIDLLIDELTVAALQAVEQAAAEAARAATLAGLEREAAALREARRRKEEAEAVKRDGKRKNVLTAVIFFTGGLAAGVAGVLFIKR